jgi:hypothetical protein
MKATALLFLLSAPAAFSAIIVGLDPSDPSNLLNLPSGSSVLTTNAPSNNSAGLTMNVTFTPNATDIGQTTNAVNLVEIGGNANGTGLYLLGGELYFLGKMVSGAGSVIGSFNDLDFSSGNNMVGLRSSFGQLTAGVEYSVGVIYDPLGTSSTVTIGILPEGGSLFQESYTFSNVGGRTNWSGNDTITAFAGPANAGGGNTVGGNAFQEGLSIMNGLSGTTSGAYLWNAQGTLIPEPSTSGVLGLAGLLLMARRRW